MTTLAPSPLLSLYADPDWRAFAAAMIREPEEDSHRLGCADWLEERGQGERAELIRVQCELARMPVRLVLKSILEEGRTLHRSRGGPDYCEFTMYLPDECKPGDRIDFPHHVSKGKPKTVHGLRVVKIVPSENGPSTVICCRDEHSKPWPGTKLRARESALLAAHGDEWRLPGVCERCGGSGDKPKVPGPPPVPGPHYNPDCPTCHGTGRTGVLGEPMREWRVLDAGVMQITNSAIPVTWQRGFPRIEVPVAWYCEEKRVECKTCRGRGRYDPPCDTCEATGRVADPDSEYIDGTMDCPDCDSEPCPSCDGSGAGMVPDYPHARQLWREQGYCEVKLDREPYQNGAGYAWYKSTRDRPVSTVLESANVPDVLFEKLDRRAATKQARTRWVAYPTPAAANRALAQAAGEMGVDMATDPDRC